jgi:zinc transport system substrate-binding protein
LDNLDKTIKEKLINSRNKNYIAVHNAYKYFAKRYDLTDAIPVTIDHDSNVGAQTMLDLRKLVADHKVVCLFQEPQFDAKIIDSLAKDSNAKIGKLDAEWGPEEADIKDAYFDMMNNLADSFKQCLN